MTVPGALSTDLYQLTMAAAYFEAGLAERQASFELFVRTLPADRGYAVAAGLAPALEFLRDFAFTGTDLDFLRNLPVFRHVRPTFFEFLRALRFSGDVRAMPEGTVFFAGEPVLCVTAPIIEAQIVETHLLALVNFQSLVATKAARIVQAAAGRDVIDFGTRRAHGPEAGILAARAAYLGGCAATSNVEAGRRYGIPVAGTMAHSYVMAFDSEEEAFRRYLDTFPESTFLLLDTYDTATAARVAARLGERVRGVRIDSGDLVALSREVREILDGAGLRKTRIAASGDLNEHRIADLLTRGAEIDLFGVGTEMVTSRDDPAMPGVYKLVELEGGRGGAARLKLSSEKDTLPGRKQVFRESRAGQFLADEIALIDQTGAPGAEALLVPCMVQGRPTREPDPLPIARERTNAQIAALPEGVRRIRNPEIFPVRISGRLRELAEATRRAFLARAKEQP